MCVSDAGNGLRNTDFVNAYPAGIHVGTRCALRMPACWQEDPPSFELC